MDRLSWGVLSTAKIARVKVIPPLQRSRFCRVDAIASRDAGRAGEVAEGLGIARAYGSYEELLADPGVQVVYNPLPNHLHVEWTRRAAEAGKHVLCEKPVGLTAADAEELVRVRDRTGVRIQEAFMVRTHPQWLKAREIVAGGRIGELRAIQGLFSYMNTDPADIRNRADIGGGGLLDIGCYPITTARFVTGREPGRVAALIDRDPAFGTDRLGSALLDLDGVQCAFTYSTQLAAHQTMRFLGTKGRLIVEIPFNALNDRPCRLLIYDGSSLSVDDREVVEVPACDQYGVAGDAFAASILEDRPQPVPLEDSVLNMRVIDAVFRAAANGTWERP